MERQEPQEGDIQRFGKNPNKNGDEREGQG
jgi:hypothetical protein